MSGSEQFSGRGLKTALLHSRFILLAGFGGLLLLMAFAGVDSLVTIREIQNSNDANREEFLWRTRLLEKIRSDVYLSGTYVRDYVLEPDPHKAESNRVSLLQRRADIDGAMAKYRSLLRPEEMAPLAGLTREL